MALEDKDIEMLIKDHDENNDNRQILLNFIDNENVDYMIYGRYSLLITAVTLKKYDLAELFLDMGADVNKQNPRGETSLYIACTIFRNPPIDLILLLLNKGAEINEVIRFGGDTTLLEAINYSTIEVVKILLEHGADPNLGERNENNALAKAVMKRVDEKSLEMIKLLLEYGADINKLNVKGYSALFFALAFMGKYDFDNAEYLLENGANPYIPDEDNIPLIENNLITGDTDVMEKLVKKIDELHYLNVSYKMLNIAKGLDQEHPIEELDEDTFHYLYKKLLDMPYDYNDTLKRAEQNRRQLRPIHIRGQNGGRKRRNKINRTLRRY